MKKTEKPQKGTPIFKGVNKHDEIKTDYPLSEKDQVKQAEEKMRKKKEN